MPPSEQPQWQIALWRHHPVADQDARLLAESTLEFQRRFPMDIVKITPGGTYHAVDYGLVDGWCDDPLGRRTILRHAVVEPLDWDRVAIAQEFGASASRVLTAASLVRAQLPSEKTLLVSVFSPLTQAIQLAGFETVRRHMTEAPQILQAALARLAASTARLIAEFGRIGLDGIYFATQHMAHPFFTPDEYAAWGQPFDHVCMAAAGVMTGNVLHAHGDRIHLSVTLDPAKWALHYEENPGNPPLNAFPGRVLLGIPAPRLAEAGQTVEGAVGLLNSYAHHCHDHPALLSVGCVLPLAFPDAVIDHWLAAARGF